MTKVILSEAQLKNIIKASKKEKMNEAAVTKGMTVKQYLDSLPKGSIVTNKQVLSLLKRRGLIYDYSQWGYLEGCWITQTYENDRPFRTMVELFPEGNAPKTYDGTEMTEKEYDSHHIGGDIEYLGNRFSTKYLSGCFSPYLEKVSGESDGQPKPTMSIWGSLAESKQGDKPIFTLNVEDIDEDYGSDDIRYAQTYYSEDEAIEAAREFAQELSDSENVINIFVMAGETETKSGNVYGEPYDIYCISNKPKAETMAARKKAGYSSPEVDEYIGEEDVNGDVESGNDVVGLNESYYQCDGTYFTLLPAKYVDNFTGYDKAVAEDQIQNVGCIIIDLWYQTPIDNEKELGEIYNMIERGECSVDDDDDNKKDDKNVVNEGKLRRIIRECLVKSINNNLKESNDIWKPVYTLKVRDIENDREFEEYYHGPYYSSDEAIDAAWEIAVDLSDYGTVVNIFVMAGENEKENGDVYGEDDVLYCVSNKPENETIAARQKAGYSNPEVDEYYTGEWRECSEHLLHGFSYLDTKEYGRIYRDGDYNEYTMDEYGKLVPLETPTEDEE